jgi:hypothetical protein
MKHTLRRLRSDVGIAVIIVILSWAGSCYWTFSPSSIQTPDSFHYYVGLAVNIVCTIAVIAMVQYGPWPLPLLMSVCGLASGKLVADTFVGQLIVISVPPIPFAIELPWLAASTTVGFVWGVFSSRTAPPTSR